MFDVNGKESVGFFFWIREIGSRIHTGLCVRGKVTGESQVTWVSAL